MDKVNNNYEDMEFFQGEITINEEKKRRINLKSIFKIIANVLNDYCSNTTIHGVRYFAEDRPLKEKFFWLCIFVFPIYCCSSLIIHLYEKWDETPVIVSFSEKSTPVWSIPFPAITICSETKRMLKSGQGYPYAKFFEQLTDDVKWNRTFDIPTNLTYAELEEFRTLLQICNTHIIDDGVPLLSSNSIEYCDVLDRLLPPFKRNFLYCKWFNHFGDCDELFVRTYTEEGICFTFNALNATNIYRENSYQYHRMGLQNPAKPDDFLNRTSTWSLENGYALESGVNTYPVRVLSSGSRAGLFIALQDFKHEVDYSCRGPIQGFKVLLHSPDDVPCVSKQFMRIPMGKEVLINVKPNMITTSAGIANYSPLRRQCYLNSERSLKYFKLYTQNNCELECLTNYTLKKCGCVKFSMPRTTDMPVCNEDKIHCYDQAEDEVLMKEFSEGLKGSSFNYRGQTECQCLPACTSLAYNAEISQGDFDLIEMLKAAGDDSFLKEFPGSRMSRLSIYFKENQFITSKRSELYGVTDFLANCGGIFGLFMGCSFLSVVELFYHLTLRLWSDFRRMTARTEQF